MQVSFRSLVEMVENFPSAGTTYTFPTSLAKKRLRPSETGDAVKPSLPLPIRSL